MLRFTFALGVVLSFATPVAAQEWGNGDEAALCTGGHWEDRTEIHDGERVVRPVCILPVRPRVSLVSEGTPNHNVIGGGVFLFLATYGGSVACAFLLGAGVPWLIPFGSIAGVVDGPAYGSIGAAFAIGQVISIVLMVLGATDYRRNRYTDASVGLTPDGLTVHF